MLVKLGRTRAIQLEGLEADIVPIMAAKRKVAIKIREKNNKTIQRTATRVQFPITPAYAFTNYHSQGQTLSLRLSNIIIDLARPPTGGPLTNFNYYVALS